MTRRICKGLIYPSEKCITDWYCVIYFKYFFFYFKLASTPSRYRAPTSNGYKNDNLSANVVVIIRMNNDNIKRIFSRERGY